MENEMEISEEVNVVAWSMGTLKALEFIKTNKVNKLVLMAPTSDFTKTNDIELINNMIKGIKINKEETLNSFYRLNFTKNVDYMKFIEEYHDDIKALDENRLVEGLKYLRDTKIDKHDFENVKEIYVIVGVKDRVISLVNSEEFLDKGKLTKYNLGHNFIYKNKDLRDLVRSITID